jgi:hypothetical protein
MIPIEEIGNLTLSGPEVFSVPVDAVVFYPPYYFHAYVFVVGVVILVIGFILGRRYQRNRTE